MSLQISYLQSNLSKNIATNNSFDISQYLQFNESTTRSSNTISFVTRYTAMPSLLILIFVGYPDYGMHYQS